RDSRWQAMHGWAFPCTAFVGAFFEDWRKLGPDGIVLRFEVRHDVEHVLAERERIVAGNDEGLKKGEQSLHLVARRRVGGPHARKVRTPPGVSRNGRRQVRLAVLGARDFWIPIVQPLGISAYGKRRQQENRLHLYILQFYKRKLKSAEPVRSRNSNRRR